MCLTEGPNCIKCNGKRTENEGPLTDFAYLLNTGGLEGRFDYRYNII